LILNSCYTYIIPEREKRKQKSKTPLPPISKFYGMIAAPYCPTGLKAEKQKKKAKRERTD